MNNVTKRSKIKIAVSAAISVLLIATIILFIAVANENSSKLAVIAVIICALAVISLIIVIVARLRRNEYTKTFTEEYYEVFEAVRDGINGSNLTKSEKQEVIGDITSMLYHAQKTNRNVTDVVGEDTHRFVKKIEESYGSKNSVLYALLNGFIYLAFVLCVMQTAVFFMREDGVPFFKTLMSVSILPYMMLLSFIVIPVMRNFIAKQKIGRAVAAVGILVLLYIAAHEVLYRINHNIKWLENYLNGEFVFLSSYVMVGIVLGICAVCFATKMYLRRRSIKNI